MGRLIDLTGRSFNRLTVIKRVDKNATNSSSKWECICTCGNIKVIRSADLLKGTVKSCGCLRDEKTSQRMKTHGKSKTLLYEIWQSMKQRCNNPNNKDYKNYGGRGLVMDEEWQNDFSVFQKWASNNGYKEHLTVERLDVNKGYCEENCTWIANELQWKNRRTTNFYEYKGDRDTIRFFSEKYNINYNTLRARVNNYKWTIEKALETEVAASGRASRLSNK